jgi:hypothetical protein
MQKEELDGERVFVIQAFLTPAECEGHIRRSEAAGYGDAPITTARGFVMRKDIRDNARVIVDDEGLAGSLFERARSFLPARMERRYLLGLNERFRYYRYDVGQTFLPHYDGSFERSSLEGSRLTFMIYLNDGFAGGETAFYEHDGTPRLRVAPKQGTALVFEHRQLHEGAPVESGRKYVLRTDVMYGFRW